MLILQHYTGDFKAPEAGVTINLGIGLKKIRTVFVQEKISHLL